MLGVADIEGRDSFFDLGGHSLLAVQAHRAIRDELGARALSITDIFRFPVLEDLTARVAALQSGPIAPAQLPDPVPAVAVKAPAPAVATTPAPTPQLAPRPAPAEAPANDRARARQEAMARRREMRARRSA